jgi:predicted DNA-binding transcriptional regulator AlpA
MTQIPFDFAITDDSSRLLTIKDICRLTSFSKAQVHRLVAASSFPTPIRISARRRVWCPLEIQRWLATRRNASEPLNPGPRK